MSLSNDDAKAVENYCNDQVMHYGPSMNPASNDEIRNAYRNIAESMADKLNRRYLLRQSEQEEANHDV